MSSWRNDPKIDTNPLEKKIFDLLWDCAGPDQRNCKTCLPARKCRLEFDNLPTNITDSDYGSFLMKITSYKSQRRSIERLKGDKNGRDK